MNLFNQDQKNLQVAISSALIFLVCFFCLNLFEQSAQQSSQTSQILPVVLNATEPYLITGNIDRLQPDLEQLILGTRVARIDIHGADSSPITSIRNLDVDIPPVSGLQEFSSAIVLDNALAATLILQEYLPLPANRTWANLLISFACALAAAMVMLLLNTLKPEANGNAKPYGDKYKSQDNEEDETDQNFEEDYSTNFLSINKKPKGRQKLVLLIRLSDVRDHLVRADEVDIYMTRIWRITDRMADNYGISCIGIQSGTLIFVASGSNSAVALRHSIMFGWNLCHPESFKSISPATLIAPVDFADENPCHALALASNEKLIDLQREIEQIPDGAFQIHKSLENYLPQSVDTILADDGINLKLLSIENRLLDLWKKQTQL